MSIEALVSIIIPTYNRAHLIEETLHSILDQNYSKWECIIVDDGSTDHSENVISEFSDKDQRFQLLHRPSTKPKGANSCRNIGLEKAKGDYIIFFDSDDLMTQDHVSTKMEAITKNNVDYVITKTKYYNHNNDSLKLYYRFDQYEITPHNYIAQKINWLTYDACIKSSVAKSISFNEKLLSSQEFNYFAKLTVKTCKALFIDKEVTLRRYHSNSIRANLRKKKIGRERQFIALWETYLDLKGEISKNTEQLLLYKCINLIYSERKNIDKINIQFIKEVLRLYRIDGINFFLLIVFRKFSKRGFSFKEKLRVKYDH